MDNTAPQIVNCTNLEFCSFEANCSPTFVELPLQATENCVDSLDLKFTWTIDLYNDGTMDVEGTTNSASGGYPNGTHLLTYKVTDLCGNWSTCIKLFTIRDCKKPTPICINGISVDLMPSTSMATVWATSLEAGDSYDNCTKYENLTFLVARLSQLTPGQSSPTPGTTNEVVVNCDDVPPANLSSQVEVVVWAMDEAGNWDYCIFKIWVQDNMSACGNGQNSTIIASFKDQHDEPIKNVTVDLTGFSQQTLQTTTSGAVVFSDLPLGQNAVVSPLKDLAPLNGVSTYDLLLIQKHLHGIKAFTSPFQYIAGDVNNSCKVSISDIVELRKMDSDTGPELQG